MRGQRNLDTQPEALCDLANPGEECGQICTNAYGQGTPSKTNSVACYDSPSGGSCEGWDPAEDVTFQNGVYHIPISLVESLIADPSPLWYCDDAQVRGRSAGYFAVDDANSGELLYELGLRDDDIPRTLNGMSLEFYLDVLTAFVELWYNDEEVSYALTLTRGGGSTTLYYVIDE